MYKDTGNPPALAVGRFKRYCEQTGKEMAEELGIPWGGCTQEESSYEEVD